MVQFVDERSAHLGAATYILAGLQTSNTKRLRNVAYDLLDNVINLSAFFLQVLPVLYFEIST